MIDVRPATGEDFGAIWEIFHSVVAAGDSYAFDPATEEEEARAVWMSSGIRTYVATEARKIMGTYLLKPNQPGLGSHVANAAFMVRPDAQGHGIGRIMAEHALVEASRLGYLAMQFNLVVASNHAAVQLWERLGFSVIGRVPDAFQHRKLGLVDALIMYRKLEADSPRAKC